MGHKVNPIGLRLGINRTWDSRWFAGRDYAKLLHDDLKLRNHLRTKLSGAGVSRVVIEHPAKKPRVTIYAARPGVVEPNAQAEAEPRAVRIEDRFVAERNASGRVADHTGGRPRRADGGRGDKRRNAGAARPPHQELRDSVHIPQRPARQTTRRTVVGADLRSLARHRLDVLSARLP